MEFKILKCAMSIMNKRKTETIEGIELSSQRSMRTFGEKRKLQILGNIRKGYCMVPTYMVIDYSLSIYTDST